VNTGLLSRIAETLFWTGRYVERADDTARIVDVYVHRLLGEPRASEDADCRVLFSVLGIPAPADVPLDIDATVCQLAYDTKNPSAIAGAIGVAKAGARAVRDVISSEMWECLNVTALSLAAQRRSAERLGPNIYLRYVRERAALFFGLADSTMSRDEAWRFLVLGRSLERVDMTARLLMARMPDTSVELGWPMVLRACGAHESFLRSHGWGGSRGGAAEFLVLDRLFPRSVLHSLATAEECLAALDPGAGRAGMADPARRPIGALRTRLEYSRTELPADQLTELLGTLQETCVQASEAIADRYFSHTEPVAWASGG
jgi:uncharacterized alpha-E superfamily protein